MSVDPYDEERILAADTIIRKISSQYIVPNDNTGGKRLSSMAFQPSSDPNGGMSIDLETNIVAAGLDPKEFIHSPDFVGAVAMKAGDVRNLNLRIGYDPLPENPHHGEVWGNNRPNRFSDSQKKGLRRAARWYTDVDGVEIL